MNALQDRLDAQMLADMQSLRERCLAPELVEIVDNGQASGTRPRYQFRILDRAEEKGRP